MDTFGTAIGKYAPDFELPGTDGTVHHLARLLEQHRAIAVVFMCNQLNFLYLRDVTQDVAAAFGAQKTPHVFLLNQQGVLCYKGAIDDHAQDPGAVKTQYLKDAISAVLSGAAIAQSSTEPVGCSVKWRNS